MTHQEHLPDWQDRSMSDPGAAMQALAALGPHPSRRSRSLALLICDAQGRALCPVVVDRPPLHPQLPEPVLSRVFGHLAGMRVVFAHSRPGPPLPTHLDHQWRRAAEVAAAGRVELLGSYLISRAGIRPILLPPALPPVRAGSGQRPPWDLVQRTGKPSAASRSSAAA